MTDYKIAGEYARSFLPVMTVFSVLAQQRKMRDIHADPPILEREFPCGRLLCIPDWSGWRAGYAERPTLHGATIFSMDRWYVHFNRKEAAKREGDIQRVTGVEAFERDMVILKMFRE